jgi:hypothetical protein
MEQWEKVQKENEAKRKAAAVSNRKRLKAETVQGIDDLLKVIGSIHFDAVEGLQWGGEIRLSINDLSNLKKHGDELAKAFKLEGAEV